MQTVRHHTFQGVLLIHPLAKEIKADSLGNSVTFAQAYLAENPSSSLHL